MRYGRSRLIEFALVAIFGVGGGFYVFQPEFEKYQIEHNTEKADTGSTLSTKK